MRRGKKLLWVAGAAFCLFAFAAHWVLSAPGEVERQKQLARAAGIPTKWSEFPRPAPIPVSENAAGDYRLAVALFPLSKGPRFPGPVSAAERERRRAAQFAAMQPAIEVLLSGAAKPGCDFSDAPTPEPPMGRDTASRVAELVQDVCMEAEREADQRHPVAALSRLGQVAPVGGHLAEIRADVTRGTGLATATDVCRSVQAILRAHWMEPGVSDAARAALTRIEVHPDLVQILEVQTVREAELLAQGPKAWTLQRNPRSFYERAILPATRVPGMLERWRATEWRTIRREVAAVRSAGGDWVKLDHALGRIHAEEASGPDGLFLANLGSSPTWTVTSIPRITAIKRVTDQAAAVLDIYRRTGKLPDKLPLGGDEAIDPRLNKPLLYQAAPTGFFVQAAGDLGVYFNGSFYVNGRLSDLVRFDFALPAKP